MRVREAIFADLVTERQLPILRTKQESLNHLGVDPGLLFVGERRGPAKAEMTI